MHRHFRDVEQLGNVKRNKMQELTPLPQQPPQEKIMEAEDGAINLLSDDLLREVPLRVDLLTIPACKCVSKLWRDLIDEPSFIPLCFSLVKTQIPYGIEHLLEKKTRVLEVKKAVGSETFEITLVNGILQSYRG